MALMISFPAVYGGNRLTVACSRTNIERFKPHNQLLRISIWCAPMSGVEDDLLGSIESEESSGFRNDFALYTYKLTQG